MFGNLSLQEPELSKVTRSGTGCLALAPVRVGLIIKARLGLGSLGETDTDPMEDRADQTLVAHAAATNLIYTLSLGFDCEYGREVYMVE
jgi:hypothetical protein